MDGLEKVVLHLTGGGEEFLDAWPISDFLHLLKNACTRIVLGTPGADAQSATITAASLNTFLKIGKPLVAHSPLDLIKDDLALKTFTLGNLLTLWRNVEVLGYISSCHLCRSIWLSDAIIYRKKHV
jgi:hypothetical protein